MSNNEKAGSEAVKTLKSEKDSTKAVSSKKRPLTPPAKQVIYRHYLLTAKYLKDERYTGTALEIVANEVGKQKVKLEGPDIESVIVRLKASLDECFPDASKSSDPTPPQKVLHPPIVSVPLSEPEPQSIASHAGLEATPSRGPRFSSISDDGPLPPEQGVFVGTLVVNVAAIEELQKAAKKDQQMVQRALTDLHERSVEREAKHELLIRELFARLEMRDTDHSPSEHIVSIKVELDRLASRLSGKIDLNDAKQVLNLRHEIESFVQSSLVHSMSKQIMPVVDLLKERLVGGDPSLIDIVRDLDSRCRQAGLIPLDKLYG